jgi:hypothetical protein
MHIADTDTFMTLLQELQLHPQSVSEYDLLPHLRDDTRSGFATARSTTPVRLQAIHAVMSILDPRQRPAS